MLAVFGGRQGFHSFQFNFHEQTFCRISDFFLNLRNVGMKDSAWVLYHSLLLLCVRDGLSLLKKIITAITALEFTDSCSELGLC